LYRCRSDVQQKGYAMRAHRLRGLYFLLVILVGGCSGGTPVAHPPGGAASVPAGISTAPAPTPAGAEPAPDTTPTGSADRLVFTHSRAEPIISHGAATAWDAQYTDPGAVVFYGGQFHMFRNGFRAWPASVQIGYATSPDGLNWTEQGEAPVLTSAQVPYAGTAALASSVLIQDDGTWVLYFYTWATSTTRAAGAIGRATAPAPTGPWTPDPLPVLQPGPSGAWDAQSVRSPHVVYGNDEYRMYYSGAGADQGEMIGLATSLDGKTWTKYDDPGTTSAAFAASDPVFRTGAADAWDAGLVHQPRVFATSDGWMLIYRGNQRQQPGTMGIGVATSPDGLHWTRAGNAPVLTAQAIGQRDFYFTSALYHEGTLFLYWEVMTKGFTNIHVATATGPLPMIR
jgi:predicted GH43/DUF377 family glycosyl hydrolase